MPNNKGYDTHSIRYYTMAATNWVCAHTLPLPNPILRTIQEDHPEIGVSWRALDVASSKGDIEATKRHGRAWMQAWQRALKEHSDVATRQG
jgi:hypothetical protein